MLRAGRLSRTLRKRNRVKKRARRHVQTGRRAVFSCLCRRGNESPAARKRAEDSSRQAFFISVISSASFGGGHGFFRKLAHFIGHHGKAASGLACPRRLNGRIQRKKVGLVRNVRNHAHDAVDILSPVIELRHVFLQFQRGFLHFAHALHNHLYNLLTGFGLLPGFGRSFGSGAGIARHLLHRCVHLVHGRGGFLKPLRGLGSAVIGLFNLGRKL